MDLALFGRYFLDFALLYPSAFLCLASLWEKLRTPMRTACIAAGCITLLCFGCAALCTVFGLNSNSLLPAIVLVSFWLLRWRVTPEVTVSQTAFLFSISAVMMAVCSLLSIVLNAQAEISNSQTVCLASTALLRLGLAAVLTVLFWFTAVQWSRWLLREYSGEAFWAVRMAAARPLCRFSGILYAAGPRRGAGRAAEDYLGAGSVHLAVRHLSAAVRNVPRCPGVRPQRPGWTGKTSCWPWSPAGIWSCRPIWTTPAVCDTTSGSTCM